MSSKLSWTLFLFLSKKARYSQVEQKGHVVNGACEGCQGAKGDAVQEMGVAEGGGGGGGDGGGI